MRFLASLILALPALSMAGPACAGTSRAPAHIPMGDLADAPSGFTEMCTNDPGDCLKSVADAPASSTPVSPAAPARAVALGSKPLTADSFPPLRPTPISLPAWAAEKQASTGAIATAPRDPASPIEPGDAPKYDDRGAMRLLQQINHRVNHNVRQISDLRRYGVDELWRPAGSGPDAEGDCEDIALEKRNELIRAGMPSTAVFLATVYVRGIGLHTVALARLPEGDFVLDSIAPEVTRWDRISYIWLRIQSPDRPMEWHRLGDTTAI
jgi:predicted transglutaminase-like cysteine proteinase